MENTNIGSKLNTALVQVTSSVLHDMQQSISSELSSMRQQNEQVKSLLVDAVGTLHDAFSSIHAISVQQSELEAQDCAQANELNVQQQKHLGSAIRALQFEDIAMQNLKHTDKHLDCMEDVLNILKDGLQGLNDANMDMEKYVQQMSKVDMAMLAYQQTIQLTADSPVSQKSMDEGDIELF